MLTAQARDGASRAPAGSAGSAGSLRVIPIDQVRNPVELTADATVVLDATGVDNISLPTLARAVHWQRHVLSRGRVVLAVSQSAARCLIACGLHTVLPHRLTLESAMDAATASTGPRAPRQG
jgi:hypothetical protein